MGKMVAAHPKSLLLQTEIATQKVEDLADTIHLAADTVNSLSWDGDALNACNYARAGALEAYEMVDRVVNGVGAVTGAGCLCIAGICPLQGFNPTCGYPRSGYGALQSQADALWNMV